MVSRRYLTQFSNYMIFYMQVYNVATFRLADLILYKNCKANRKCDDEEGTRIRLHKQE